MNRNIKSLLLLVLLGFGARGLAMSDPEMNNIYTTGDRERFEGLQKDYEKKQLSLKRGVYAVTIGAAVISLGSLFYKRSLFDLSSQATWTEKGVRGFALFSGVGLFGGIGALFGYFYGKRAEWCRKQKLMCKYHEEIKDQLKRDKDPVTLANKKKILGDGIRDSVNPNSLDECERLEGFQELNALFKKGLLAIK